MTSRRCGLWDGRRTVCSGQSGFTYGCDIERDATHSATREPTGRSPCQARTLAALPLATSRLASTHVPVL